MLGSSLVNSSELLTEDDVVGIIATIIVATVVESQDRCGVRSFSAAQTNVESHSHDNHMIIGMDMWAETNMIETEMCCEEMTHEAGVDVSLNGYSSEWWRQFFEICDDPGGNTTNTSDLAGKMAGPNVVAIIAAEETTIPLSIEGHRG